MTPPPLDERLDAALAPASRAFSDLVFFTVRVAEVDLPLVVLWLIAASLFFTIYFRGINLRGIGWALRTLRGDFDDEDAPGEISHFQALATALSGTVGIGNIGGVAVAVSIGGAGATLWMVLAGLLGMATKFVECTLSVRYRRHDADGSVSGGPMFYLRQGLAERGRPRLGRALGAFYAAGIMVGCLGIGNMFQANQAFVQLRTVTGGTEGPLAGWGWAVGVALAVLVGLVIIGGIRSIAAVTARLVPFMGAGYVVGTFVVIAMNARALPAAVDAILVGAFTGSGVTGGILGAAVVGMQRAVFSNEAGIGSASIAHAAVRTHLPATEGLVALFGPFLDTVVICTLTALTLGVAAVTWPDFMSATAPGVAMTSDAFGRTISWSPIPLAFVAVLFAVSTMISWSYYGRIGCAYFVGDHPRALLGFNAVYCAFVVVGASIELESVLAFSDAMVFVLCLPNTLGLVLLAPVAAQELAKLRRRARRIDAAPR
ncbi:MAG: alanine/glycine:cation symporter family protein [Myxococcota bacterium]